MHPLVAAFPVKQYLTNDDYTLDFTGMIYRRYFSNPGLKDDFSKDKPMRLEYPNIAVKDLPALNYEYVEYLPIFEAVEGCGDELRMLDLGAGRGRWSAVAVCVARAKGIACKLFMVEAEPAHFAEISLCMADNCMPGTDCILYEEAVIGDEGGKEPSEFPLIVSYRGLPEYSDPYSWRGQCVVRIRDHNKVYELPEFYYGKKLHVMGDNSRFIKVPTVTLNQILVEHGKMDLVIMDVQGEEANVVSGAKDILDEFVGCVGIETHSPEVDRDIRDAFTELGWETVVEHRLIANPGLPQEAADGYQSYRNPNFRK